MKLLKLGEERITIGSKMDINKIKNKKVRLYKYEKEVEIKNFIYEPTQLTQINIIQSSLLFYKNQGYALLNTIGSKKFEVSIKAPDDYEDSLSKYVDESVYALVNNQIHIFGGKEDGYRVKLFRDLNFGDK